MKTKPFARMSVAELTREMEIWAAVVDCPKGPGTPSNGAREAAERRMHEAEAWLHRRRRFGGEDVKE
jgi:hypothetical protein